MKKNPYILLAERIKRLVPDSKMKEGMGAENAYDEINRCFDEIEKMIKLKWDNLEPLVKWKRHPLHFKYFRGEKSK